MIIFFSINQPNIIFNSYIIDYILHRLHSTKHGVIHIIIPMHTVATDEKKVFKYRYVFLNEVKISVCSEICRIGFWNSYNHTVENIMKKVDSKENIWAVNTEEEYHEAKENK